MKDYSLNTDEQKKYILSYKIEDGKIIVKLASREIYTIPYTEENEQSVISKMESQARKAEVKPLDIVNRALSITQPLLTPIAVVIFINNGGWFSAMLLGIFASEAILYPAWNIINVMKQRDIKKLNYFLDHQQELNDSVENNEKMLLNVSKKTVSKIKAQQNEGKKPFNINNIDNYSLKDLRTLKENFERIPSFGFRENESMLKEPTPEKQGNVLKKTFNSKKANKKTES